MSTVTDIPPPGDHVCHPHHQPHRPQLQHLHGFHQDRVQSRRPPLPDHGHHRDNIHPRHNPQGRSVHHTGDEQQSRVMKLSSTHVLRPLSVFYH